MKNLDSLKEDQLIRVENHKNDRYLVITKPSGNTSIREDGYSATTHNPNETEAKSVLHRLIDYEFPRSHKLRIKIRKVDESSSVVDMSPWSSRKTR